MCGIFGYIGKKNHAAEIVLDGLKKLEYRGYDSWGIAVKKGTTIKRERHVGKIGAAKTKLPVSNLGLGHTRWATHGGVTIGNAHPHVDCANTLCLVHNGIVENFRPLKEKLVKKHKFLSETDTEVALHLIESKAQKQPVARALRVAFNQVTGMNAFIVLNAKKDELLAVKNGSPLVIGVGKGENFIASDLWALLDHTNRVIFLEDGQLAQISAGQVKLFDAASGKALKPQVKRLDWQAQQSRLGRFHHFMEKEIYDQPKILDDLSRLSPGTIASVTRLIKKADKTFLLGCGTASYAALFGEYLLNFSGYDAQAIVGSEFQKFARLLTPKQAFLMLSQSGETIDVVDAVNLAKKKKMRVVGITNVLGSTLYRKSDLKILLGAGQEVAVASTKAFTAKLAILTQLAYQLNGNLDEAKKLIAQAARATQGLLSGKVRADIKKLATKIKDEDDIFAVGRLTSFPIALETALKIKEVSYAHAEGYAGGELKHGPIALIDQGTPCIVIAPKDQSLTDSLSAAHELKARGGLIIGISPQNDPVFDVHFKVPDLKEASAIPAAVIAQLLAYDIAVARGLNPDKPRNLAKSVTVR
ncbi:MAG: Glucosamine/fructose-6-phosphate aminotransferase, isomerizing [Candidatus Beckwithbacteria bacterium GW2011_GWB1_47_15]|uniref:Glutamine--fructose-6-phosphate aminotransferase [isomerizing] n=1 Tax=Candidatus Beckwithbacteria bacterium GW2011_GWB1_47_15 TaxID=1618371 RepID=A0A0G1U5T8_9BACT|nr:MAG: glucosamine/fructose-6-phosphate aminotransferase, glucosamine--fructose-6-phosphate aminotransferase (isomerizing) [Candidatus Beckwithbacteria bacterium GW2011_GWC1_49_16]KKU35599.1 MAG: Glucosamine/fructose-6-phosphate aminotransferase, isomerizing [Candidatus Beckwithbacteria bacterium GW2011_GWA1_46_30]KKU61653.1 MAG: Glucosamine/fructose-6-phosphate aminotransferase, isomerizing [Candidatus Beckwithbacteria bacterium GW2011_GWB1_47_15]KKU72156.1 MAG: Glucosamine/fructose-6-phosphat